LKPDPSKKAGGGLFGGLLGNVGAGVNNNTSEGNVSKKSGNAFGALLGNSGNTKTGNELTTTTNITVRES